MLRPNAFDEVTLHKDWVHTQPYPPLGFFPFVEHELGNGDCFGLYWPIGREEFEPLVVETWHDEWAVQPSYSNLHSFLVNTADIGDEYPEPPLITDDEFSPKACFLAAKEQVNAQNIQGAIDMLERALSVLPEYTDALTMLWGQYLRVGRTDDAARVAVQAIISPPSFGQRPLKPLRWLCTAASLEFQSDPIWASRTKLKMVFGRNKENSDYSILLEAIQEYLQQKEFVRAAVLMQTYAELMSSETTAFQSRYGFETSKFLAWQIDVSKNLAGGPRNVL